MDAFNPDRFAHNAAQLAEIALRIAPYDEAAYLCIAAAASIIAQKFPADKDPAVIALLQSNLAVLIAEQRNASPLIKKECRHGPLH